MAVNPLPLQSLFPALVQSSEDAIISKDLNSIVTSWNRVAEQMFVYTADEMIGQSIRKIIPHDRQHEEDEVLSRMRQGLTVEHYETVRLRKNGSLVPISLSVSPIRNDAGTVIGASSLVRRRSGVAARQWLDSVIGDWDSGLWIRDSGVDFRPETEIPGASMKRHQILIVVAVFVPLVFMAGYAAGQRQIPAQNVGQSDELLRTLDLTTELASTKGRRLRMRKVTLQPGGVLGLHNHVDRPAITYFLQGQVTYHSEGKPDNVANPGGGFAEGRATTHWAENTGNVPAVWIAVDIPQP